MIQSTSKPFINLYLLCLFFTLILFIAFVDGTNYVREACSVTRYQDLCVKSLASYSNNAKRSPSRWARAGVSVTISEVKVVSQYLDTTRKHGHIRGTRNRAALADCVECIQGALDDLHKSLGVLRRLSSGVFKEQMGDVLTWLSAALTDQDTCINGFEGVRRGRKNKQISMLCDKVQNASYITSIALALVNKLATTELQDLGDDS
ncbi:pectinesterase inhibitor 6-like [Chenopodium quinoa]|uniref:pectinesterase inhibitor 6-like n=1 Tax=Chenopodium quinoa TaxID=63459 RepID=UPI000B790495|nr:pectinesterase inhibitor 6-like [Chenopodium quinoa]